LSPLKLAKCGDYDIRIRELLREPDVIVVMKIVRLRWAGI
jgi:hypothetical protein